MTRKRPFLAFLLWTALGASFPGVFAAPQNETPRQPAEPATAATGRGRGRGGPSYVSPEVAADHRVTFRIYAPQASTVSVGGEIAAGVLSDPGAPAAAAGQPAFGRGGPAGLNMTKGAGGVWSATTVRPMKSGAWRYTFSVDGVTFPDPRNTKISMTQTQVQSLVTIPGDFSETRDVPHGAVALVRYISKSLGNLERELYIYTPPGYQKGAGRFPVLYLIHGGGDSANSWSTVGRANDILDNLIAAKKALPMIIVMPNGWTPKGGQPMTSDADKDPFTAELMNDIIPFVQANYRTVDSADSRALSGLSMGGIQTLNIGLEKLGTFRYVAVMSSGWTSEDDRQAFYKSQSANFPKYNSALKLFWWGWGQTDIARENGLKVMDELKKAGVKIETRESPGGHEWANWRLYLYEVAPKLFRAAK